LAFAAFVVVASAANAQQVNQNEPPAACANANSEQQYRACFDATPAGSGFNFLSAMYLGMIAMQRQDVAASVEWFDRAQSTDGQNFTRPRLHGYRAVAYKMVGRNEEALSEARLTLSLLLRTRDIPANVWPMFEDSQINNETAFGAILPILQDADDPDLERAFDAYVALPVESWQSAAIRASTLESLDRLDEALNFSNQAVAAQPDHPLVLNNHCYLLVRLERSSEALPFCERAVAAMPASAAVRHSYASALAAQGRCDETAVQLEEARRLDSVSIRPELTCAPA
jgi:tetratricopeptide (TPR) repeat protein